ncbi:MAG: BCCT family transporter [Eubacteriaceae bacterium]|nr:BCCT family transporter [Eubacteriaceae bacterium]
MDNSLNKKKRKYDIPLIIVSVAIVFGFVILMAVKPESTLNGVNGAFDVIISYFGSILEVFTLLAVVVSIYFCVSPKYGKIKFGDEKPEYSMFSYIAMMTLAAVASALLYWSYTEWAYYYETPGVGLVPESTAALEASLGYSFFHWGISGQAIYVVIALAMSYAFYIRKVPVLQTSSVCQSMMGERLGPRTKSTLGRVIDFVVIFGILGGLGCSLGLAVPLTGGALTQVFGLKITFPVQVAIVVVIALVFTFTSFIGTKKGMKNLSNFSVILCGAMLLYIFIAGPTSFIMKNTTNAFGWMLEIFPRASLFTDPIAKTGFPEAWTMYFQAFYLNYAAMMGIFITKISKGRTVRQLSLATLLGISVGGWLVFSIDGSFAIHSHIEGLTDVVKLVNSGVGETGIYQVMGLLPGGKVILPMVMLLVIIGFVASSLDSASLSLSQTTQRIVDKEGNVSRGMRVFWCVILALVPLSIMFVKADFSALKILSIIVSVPFMVIVAFMTIMLFRWLRQDEKAGKLEKYGIKKPEQ